MVTVPASCRAAQLSPARERGVPVIGELELGWRAMRLRPSPSPHERQDTTTALTGALLARQPRPVLVGGNIGTPLASRALDFARDGLVVAEVSSFQLETIETFRPRVAVILNITPDHLDRHRTFAAYVDAKARIFVNQTASDCAVLNADTSDARLAGRTPRPFLFSGSGPWTTAGSYGTAGWWRSGVATRGDLSARRVQLRGRPTSRTCCGDGGARAGGLSTEAIRGAIGAFRAVAHRIEFVRDINGVHVYNDSKGTNVASTIKALESFPERVVLIAGGKGKGQDFAPLAAAARGRVGHAVVIGEDGDKIAAAFERAGIAVSAADSMPRRSRGAWRRRLYRRVVLSRRHALLRHVRQFRDRAMS